MTGNKTLHNNSIKHMLYCRFLKRVLLNFVSNPARRGAGSGTKMQVFKRIRFIGKRWALLPLDR